MKWFWSVEKQENDNVTVMAELINTLKRSVSDVSQACDPARRVQEALDQARAELRRLQDKLSFETSRADEAVKARNFLRDIMTQDEQSRERVITQLEKENAKLISLLEQLQGVKKEFDAADRERDEREFARRNGFHR